MSLGIEKVWGPKKSGVPINLSSKTILSQKNIGPKKFWFKGKKLSPKKLGVKKILYPKKI